MNSSGSFNSSSSDHDRVGGDGNSSSSSSTLGDCYNTTTTTASSSHHDDGRSSPAVPPNNNNNNNFTPTSLNDYAVQLLEQGRYDDAMQVWVEALQVVSAFMNDTDQQQQHENVVCDVHEEVDFHEDEVRMMMTTTGEEEQQQENDYIIPVTVSSSSRNGNNNGNNNRNDMNEVQHEQPHMPSLFFGSTFTVLPYKIHRPEQHQQDHHHHQQQQQQQNQHLVQNYDQHSSTSTSVVVPVAAPSESTSTTGTLKQQQDDDDVGQRFFLPGPLKATGNIQLEDEASGDLISFMIMFNMGWCCHLKGLSTYGGGQSTATTASNHHHGYCCPTGHHAYTARTEEQEQERTRSAFSKAVELYNLAHSIVVRDGGSVDTMISSFHFMGLLSSMQHAYMMMSGPSGRCLQEAEECNDLLLKTLMYTIDQRSYRGGAEESDDSYGGSASGSSSTGDVSQVNGTTSSNSSSSIASSAQGHYIQQHDIVEQVRRDVISDIDLMDNFVGNVLPRILDGICAPAA